MTQASITEQLDKLLENRQATIHFIGVGGSGIFPMVQLFLGMGHRVQGSDNNTGDNIDAERSMGATVFLGHRAEQIAGADLIIYSAAIPAENPELTAATQQGIPSFERADVLGWLTGRYNNCICVAGTHGKTTATGLLTQLLVEAGLKPGAFIGGKLPLIDGSALAGTSQIFAVEACEYRDTFLRLHPDIAVVLNIDADHLEYFGTLENIKKSFRVFASNASRMILANGDDVNTMDAVQDLKQPVITFGLGEGNDYRAVNIAHSNPAATAFDLLYRGEPLTRLELCIPGRHNLPNALAACAAALAVGVTPAQLRDALPHFGGTARRFEILGSINGVTVADDYAHHPTELTATLSAAMAMGYRRVWAVFQPFTYSRTKRHLDTFAAALRIPDHAVLSAVMGGRETDPGDITSADLAAKVNGAVYFERFDEIAAYVKQNAKAGDLVLTMGCGDIYKCARMILQER